jgi:hypothetical protein
MIDAGTVLQICDDFGRIPLHDAFWCPIPCTDVVKVLLNHDPMSLFILDRRGALPLAYVKDAEDKKFWIQWFDANKETLFPPLSKPQEPPLLVTEPPNSMPIPDPILTADNPELCTMVSTGRISPEEAIVLLKAEDKTEVTVFTKLENECEFDSDDDSDICAEHKNDDGSYSSDSSDYSDSDSDEDADYLGLEEGEMQEMMHMRNYMLKLTAS